MALNFPSSPAPGEVFTAEGATFIWNGTVWVAASPPVVPWASPEEAREGARADVAMSPLTVRALKGEQFLNIGTTTSIDSTPIPPEATDITLTINVNRSANSILDLVVLDDAGAVYNGTIIVEGAAYAAPVAIPTTGFLLNNDNATGTVQGTVRMTLTRNTNIWWTQSELRRGVTLMRTTGAIILSPDVPLSRLRVRNSIPGNAGGIGLLWRI